MLHQSHLSATAARSATATFLLLVMLVAAIPVSAADTPASIPANVTLDHWSCRDIVELGKKYAAEKTLPVALTEGKPCSRADLARCLLAILDRVTVRCEKEGRDAVSRSDLLRLALLHEALQAELAAYEGYLTRKESIEKLLAKPDAPEFVYQIGVNGFMRGEGAGNFSLADAAAAAGHGEGRFLYRVKPYAYWHPAEYLDVHVEGEAYGFSGGNRQSARGSLYQGFVEGKLPGQELLALKGGRQELVYGSSLVLGADSAFDGLSFDALRLRVKPAAPLTVDLFAGTYATPFSGGVKGTLAGGYATWTFSEGNAIDLYGIRDTGAETRRVGEHLDTWGVRATARIGSFSAELEPVYQSGRAFDAAGSAAGDISAYGGHLDLTGEGSIGGYHSKLLVSYALGSGSADAAGGRTARKEFRNPNNDSPLFGDMNVIGDLSGTDVGGHHASGMQIYTVGWGVDLSKELNFSASGHYFVAGNVEAGFSRRLGLETDFILTYACSDNLSLILAYDRFFTGGFFRSATGRNDDIHYGYAMLQFNLVKAKPKTAAL